MENRSRHVAPFPTGNLFRRFGTEKKFNSNSEPFSRYSLRVGKFYERFPRDGDRIGIKDVTMAIQQVSVD